jgi:hypothetical protein
LPLTPSHRNRRQVHHHLRLILRYDRRASRGPETAGVASP